MAITKGFPYNHVHLVKLSDAEFTKLDAVSSIDVDISTTTNTRISFTRPTDPASLTVVDQKDVVMSVTETRAFQDLEVTSVADSQQRIYQGREQWECALTVYRDNGSDLSPYLDNPSGHWFLYVERADGSAFYGTVDITNIAESIDDASGRLTYDVTLKVSGSQGVAHEAAS